MTHHHTLYHTLCGLCLLAALAACNDKEMCDLPHPHPGQAVVTYDWNGAQPQDVQLSLYPRDADAQLSPAYADVTPSDGIRLDMLAPGQYHASAHTAGMQNLDIAQGAATARADGDGYLASVDNLRAGQTTLTVESDQDTQASIGLSPCTRLLRVTLRCNQGDPTRVQSLTGILTGIRARRVFDANLAADRTPAPAGSIRLDFAPTADGTAFSAEHRVLGLETGAAARLTLTLRTDDGRTDTQTYDLRQALNGLDTPADTPFEANAGIDLTVTSALAPLFGIDGWGQTDGSTGGADMEL